MAPPQRLKPARNLLRPCALTGIGDTAPWPLHDRVPPSRPADQPSGLGLQHHEHSSRAASTAPETPGVQWRTVVASPAVFSVVRADPLFLSHHVRHREVLNVQLPSQFIADRC